MKSKTAVLLYFVDMNWVSTPFNQPKSYFMLKMNGWIFFHHTTYLHEQQQKKNKNWRLYFSFSGLIYMLGPNCSQHHSQDLYRKMEEEEEKKQPKNVEEKQKQTNIMSTRCVLHCSNHELFDGMAFIIVVHINMCVITQCFESTHQNFITALVRKLMPKPNLA